MTFNPELFKSQFPVFDQAENQQLVYLDNAATTQKPQCVIDAITECYLNSNGNAQRASHRLARNASAIIEKVRQQAADFVHANSCNEIVFTSGATEAINTLAYGLQSLCESGDEIVVSHSEHHANLLPWQRLVQQCDARIAFFPEENGLPDYTQWQHVINHKTRVVAVSGASNVIGKVIDFSILNAIKHQYPDIIIVLDASQLACHLPLKATHWGCDCLVFSAHKMYGPTGVGLLSVKESLLNQMQPLLVGGEMVDRVNHETSTFAQGYQRFEAGTSSLAAIAALGACFDFWQQQDRVAMRNYEASLTDYLHQQLDGVCKKYQQYSLLTQADNNVGLAVLMINSEHFDAFDLATWLDSEDIAVRVGDHCAQLLWQSLETIYQINKGLRVSLAAYNTVADIDQLVHAIDRFMKHDFSNTTQRDDLSGLSIDELLQKKGWQQRYTLLLRWGAWISKKPHIRSKNNQVKGCESSVWLKHNSHNNKHYFLIDSDSKVIKGLSVLLLLWFDGKTAEEIKNTDIHESCTALGLQKHLSTSRVNGFLALADRIKHVIDGS